MIIPLITVIIPVYKVEEYLPKCIDSIINQTYRNLEIFLVEDGSPDRCGEICDEYARKDSRIRVIHKVNGGLSDARNAALDQMTGEYVTFVDSDDYVSIDYVEVLWNLIDEYQSEIAVTLPQTFKGEECKIKNQCPTMRTSWTKYEALENMFYQELFDNMACAKLYHHSLFKEIRFPKGLLFEDLATTYKLFLLSNRIAYRNYRSYYYLLRENSIEGSVFSEAKMNSAMAVIEQMNSDRDILRPVSKAYYCRMVSFLFHILLQMPPSYSRKDMLFREIKKYRWRVLIDSKARKKARIGCLLSYLGIKNLPFFFSFANQR